jgi:hypothetical protein
MKESLKKYVSEILSAIGIEDLPFTVYECKTDALPLFTNPVEMTHEFLICINSVQLTDDNRKKLQQFLGKEMALAQGDGECFVYWFEGDRIIEQTVLPDRETNSPMNERNENIEYLKTNTRLPAWLDKFIFKDLKADYAPDFQKFSSNLDLTEEENLKYLGTYFPRSYAESFCIFDNLFQNKVIEKTCQQKEGINILTVGCGTGGDLMGLLVAIAKYFPKTKTLNIHAIDGNENALSILSRIISKYEDQSNKRINLELQQSVFSDIAGIDLSALKINAIRFDFILSFKMVCEIISKGRGAYDNSYYDFVKKFVPLLSHDGICILTDVTTKPEHSTFNPILMNRQVNSALQELKDYQTLLPLSCNLYEKQCDIECFCQKIFTVSHSKYSNDKSKVVYRVITSKLLGDAIEKPMSNVQYKIQSDKNGICCYTQRYGIIMDSYNLK